MSDSVLSINGLSKRYGSILAVNDLRLEVPKGSIFGLLGPNGSGKTTTLGMILDVIHPSSGNFEWFGQKPETRHLKRIGAILESPLFYPYISGERNLKIVAEIKGTPMSRIPEVLERVGLDERAKSRFKTYSLGMKQRLAIAGALLAEPEVLILDEPTNGLDPQGIKDIRDLIRSIASEGVTIVLASHLLDEVEKVCSHVAVLKRGELLFSGEVAGIMGGEHRVMVSAGDSRKLGEGLRLMEGVEIMEEDAGKYVLRLQEDLSTAELNRLLFEKGIVLSHLSSQNASLEQQFLSLLAQSES